MALQGWQLVAYHEKTLEYVAAEPQQVHYDIIFFPDYVCGGEISPKLEYLWAMAQMDGWQHITHNYDVQVFCNTQQNPQPLSTDAAVWLENFHGLASKKYVKKWRGIAIAAVAALAVYIAVFAALYIAAAQSGNSSLLLVMLFSTGWLFVPYMMFQAGYHLYRLTVYRKWHKCAVISACEDNSVPMIQNIGFLEKANKIISIIVFIILIDQISSFVLMSYWASFFNQL